MKSIFIPIISVFISIIAGLFLCFDAAADENTCTLIADENKVHIVVWDENSEEERQNKIFEGWLEPGEEKNIQSTTGFIVFSYKEAEDDRTFGDNHEICKDGNIIQIP
jgi:uncharacterized protein YxeA